MKSRLLLPCIVMVFFFSLNAGDDQSKSEQPGWFTKFQQEYEGNDKKKSDKWCAMFECLPKDVQDVLVNRLTIMKVRFRLFSSPLADERNASIYQYALNACKRSLYSYQIRTLEEGLAQLILIEKQLVPQFSDEFKKESFKIMLAQLHQLSHIWLYPGWHVVRCIKCALELTRQG